MNFMAESWAVPLSDIDFDSAELQALEDTLKSRWLSMGGKTSQFEQSFAQYLGVKHAIAVSSGTAALYLAFLGLGLGPGMEVILPSLTFVATASAVVYTGASPVFADISSSSRLTISPESIEQNITPKTTAIAVMHYGGFPCDMPSIMDIAKRRGLYVIEDAAHAIGSTHFDRGLGTIGDLGCFSFFANKNLVTIEGGMVTTDRDDLADKIRLLRSHGMTSLSWDRYQGQAASYDVVSLGYNYRMDDLRASLGLIQLAKLDEHNNRRRKITHIYRQAFWQHPALDVPFLEHNLRSFACHLFVVVVKEPDDQLRFRNHLKQSGIQTSLHYPPVHLFSYYRQELGTHPGMLPVTEATAQRLVTLPLYSSMTDDQVNQVIQAVLSFRS